MSVLERIDGLINEEIARLGNKKFEPYKYELKLDAQALFQLKCLHNVNETNTYKGVDISLTISKGLIMFSQKQNCFGSMGCNYYYRDYIIKRVSRGTYEVLLNFKLLESNVKSISLAKKLVLHHDRYKNLDNFRLRNVMKNKKWKSKSMKRERLLLILASAVIFIIVLFVLPYKNKQIDSLEQKIKSYQNLLSKVFGDKIDIYEKALTNYIEEKRPGTKEYRVINVKGTPDGTIEFEILLDKPIADESEVIGYRGNFVLIKAQLKDEISNLEFLSIQSKKYDSGELPFFLKEFAKMSQKANKLGNYWIENPILHVHIQDMNNANIENKKYWQ